MQRSKSSIMFEAKQLQRLVENSYEEIMSKVNRAVIENEKSFGRDATLLATYSDHAIVINESGEVFSVDWKLSGGQVKFGKKRPIEVPTVTQDNVTKQAIDGFFESGSLVDGMKKLATMSSGQYQSPLEEVQSRLDELFSGGILWRGLVKDNSVQMAQFAFDPKYGSPKIESVARFEALYAGLDEDGELENRRGDVVAALLSMTKRLNKLLSGAREAYKAYSANPMDNQTEDENAVLGRFELFSEDYIDDLSGVFDFVSESVRKSESDCVACLAFIHDEVAKRVTEFELGERLIRKVSAEFAQ